MTLGYVFFICCAGRSHPQHLLVRNTYPLVYSFVGVVFLATWLTAALDTVLQCTDGVSLTLFLLALVETVSRLVSIVAQQRFDNRRAAVERDRVRATRALPSTAQPRALAAARTWHRTARQ